MQRPVPGDYAPFYETYVSKIFTNHPLAILNENLQAMQQQFDKLDWTKGDYAYDTGKWTVKQLLQHMIDTERIFAYRALRIGRGDTTPLPGFEENDYAAAADVSTISSRALADELIALRQCHITMFSHFTVADFEKKGTASSSPVCVKALAYIMAGHVVHHLTILKERYHAFTA